MLSICMCSIMTDEMYICLHAYLMGQFINLSFKATIVRQLSWLKPEYIPACQYNLWPKSQARLDLIGSLVPYVTYNLCPCLHCRAGGSVISLGKGCHGNNLWMLRSALCSPHILGQNYPGFLYVRPVFFCSISSLCSVLQPSLFPLQIQRFTCSGIWTLAYMLIQRINVYA